jgi:type VII secretion-associated serine protease mycosin
VIRRLLACAAAVAVVLIGAPGVAAAAPDNWYLAFLHAAEANAISQGEGVTVAVIDSGVDVKHPDLTGTVLPGFNPDGVGPADASTDSDGHGTGMAGLIVGHGVVIGIAPKAKILPIKATRTTTVPRGIDWAVDHGAQVINISLGGTDDEPLRASIDRALAAGVVIVASAGNVPEVSAVEYPAAYPGVIAAAALSPDGQRAPVSVTGSQVVLAAPGDTMKVAGLGGGYVDAYGTSISSALISGVAALVKAKYPNISGREIYHRLTATADDKGAPGRDNEYGFGIVNPVKALTADVPPLPDVTTNAPAATPTNAAPPGDSGGGLAAATLLAVGVGVLLLVGLVILVVVLTTRRRPT